MSKKWSWNPCLSVVEGSWLRRSDCIFLLGALLVDLLLDIQLSGVYATAAILSSISSQPRRTAAVAGLAVTAAILIGRVARHAR